MREQIPTSAEIEAMTPRQYATYENSLRRAAKRQGGRLEKSRRRDPRAYDYGTYQLIDDEKTLHAEGWAYGLSITDAHKALLKGRRGQR